MTRLALIAALLSIFLTASCTPSAGGEDRDEFVPPALYLGWTDDPTTTITVQWHHAWPDGFRDPVVGWRHPGESEWRWTVGSWEPFAFSERIINTVMISDLDPGTRYDIRLGRLVQEGESPPDRTTAGFRFVPDGAPFCFRTLPRLGEGLRFAVGGDVYGDADVYREMNRTLAGLEVDFAVIGGDLAYANGRPDRAERWYEFFRIWTEEMVSAEGCPIPVIVGMGNHEAHGDSYEDRGRGTVARAPYLPRLFAFPGPDLYGALDMTDDLTILMLDSHHAKPVHGAQLTWLSEELEARAGAGRDIVPVYHVPAWPSVRGFAGDISGRIREHWIPLFEAHSVRMAFEHHDHAYKRTPALREGAVAEDGIVYLGDGAWGVTPRDVHDADTTWYLERSEATNHVFVVEVAREHFHVSAVRPDGNVFDSVSVRRATATPQGESHP